MEVIIHKIPEFRIGGAQKILYNILIMSSYNPKKSFLDVRIDDENDEDY